MAEGRIRLEWNQTSEILAMLYNANKPPKEEPLYPHHFHPLSNHRMRDEIDLWTDDLSFLMVREKDE